MVCVKITQEEIVGSNKWALLVFLPFFKLKLLTKKIFFRLFAIGSIEFRLMSIFAQLSLKFLEGHVVKLLMLTTPIYSAKKYIFCCWTDIVEKFF